MRTLRTDRPPTARWRAQVHEAAGEIRQALEEHEEVVVVIEDSRQATVVRHVISRSGRLRLVSASEAGPLAMQRLEADAEVILLKDPREATCRPSEEELS